MGTFAALKESRVNYHDYDDPELAIYNAYRDVKTEFANLHMLYNIGIKKNIQSPPFFSFKSEFEPKIFSYVGYFYNKSDLFEAIKTIPIESRLSLFSHGFTELIYALDQLHHQDLFHNDIKTENILTEIDNHGIYQLSFGDMGSIRQAESTNENYTVYEHTSIYTPINPKNILFNCKELKSIDVYQLGATIYMVLAGNPPYLKDFYTEDYPDFTIEFGVDILMQFCSIEAILLLKKMCDPNASSRYTTKDAIEHIEKKDFTWAK